ncbi:hypothetical protein BC940DRAFT_355049 [Gongronella butleri]|nr:hypothetical protein BC940DRAFT_355049 [Gongronella butleri]
MPVEYQCPLCPEDKDFSRPVRLRSHLLRLHDMDLPGRPAGTTARAPYGQTVFGCCSCTETFEDSQPFLDHLIAAHIEADESDGGDVQPAAGNGQSFYEGVLLATIHLLIARDNAQERMQVEFHEMLTSLAFLLQYFFGLVSGSFAGGENQPVGSQDQVPLEEMPNFGHLDGGDEPGEAAGIEELLHDTLADHGDPLEGAAPFVDATIFDSQGPLPAANATDAVDPVVDQVPPPANADQATFGKKLVRYMVMFMILSFIELIYLSHITTVLKRIFDGLVANKIIALVGF